MFSVYRTLSLRYLQRRWFRAVLIVASIALGVATLVATRALNETMSKAALASANPMAGLTDFVISKGDLTIPKALVSELANIPGVKSVQGRIFRNVYLPEYSKNVLVLGIDLLDMVKDFNDPKKKDEIFLGPQTIENYVLYDATKNLPSWLRQIPVVVGKALADEIPAGTLWIKVKKEQRDQGEKAQSLAYAGYLDAKGDAAVLGGFVLILDLPNAATVLGLKENQINRIDVALEAGIEPEKIRPELEKRISGRAQLRTPEEHNQSLQSVMSGMQTGFSLCGVAALVVGVFLVYNALSVSVAERRHEIGILLALGATRNQVWRLFAGEAGLLGLTGSLLGIPLGLGLAWLGLAPMQSVLQDIFFSFQAGQVEASPSLMVLAVLAGVVTSVIAALVPAIQASRENPAEAVRRVVKAPTMHNLVAQISISVSMVAVGTMLILLRGHLPYRIGTYGGLMLVLVGALVASPFFAALAARLFQPLARNFLSIEWRLAADNLVRSPGRTGLVIGALAAGVSLVMQTAGTIRSNRLALREWVQDTFAADLVVTSGSPVSAGQTLEMDESLGAELRQLPIVEKALPLRLAKVPFRDTQIYLLAVEAENVAFMEKMRLENPKDNALMRLLHEEENRVIISENFAALYHVTKGDTITLAGDQGPVQLKVIGQIVDYTWNHGSLILNRRDFKKHWPDDKVNVFDVYLKKDVDPQAAKEMINKRFGAQHQLHALTREELQNHIDDMIERLYGIAYGQQIVVMLVAALGVVTALLISVLQRRREMGLLRAIGASRGQVVYSVLAEACLMGVIGTLIGLAVGVPLQWYVLQVVILEESGYLFPVYIPWMGGVVIGIAAMLTATLAGLGPALHAVRQRIPEAIAYE